MSVIAGLLNLTQQPLETTVLPALLGAAGELAAGSLGSQTFGPASLGHASLKQFPRPAQLAVHALGSNLCNAISLHGRLHYRAELADALSLSTPAGRALPDAELILHAYAKWGEDCVQHLCGDFAFGLWDGNTRRLFLARAPQGIDALYYTQTPRWFAFASSVRPLLALPGFAARPNLLRCAQILVVWPTDVAQCGYEGLLRLPPAHTLSVSAGGVTRLRRYWFPETAEPLRLNSDAEYVESFLAHYTRAVQERLIGRVGATLSAGLDSSSVCALAARELRAQGKSLPTYTSVPKHAIGFRERKVLFDESAGAEATRAFLGNATSEWVRAEGVSPMAGFKRMLAVLDEPSHTMASSYWIVDLIERAQAAGLNTLLTGQMGNATVSWHGWPENLWPALLQGHWDRLRSAVPELQATWPLVLRRHFIRPLIGPLQLRFHRRTWHPDPTQTNSVLRPEFARRIRLLEHMRAADHDLRAAPFDSPAARLAVLKPGRTPVGHIFDHQNTSFGVESSDPTMDARLTEFCLRVPNEQYYRRGEYRHLLRRAMQGLLPDEVRLASRRGRQSMDFGYRVRETKAEFEAVLTQLDACPLAAEMLDLPRLWSVLKSLDRGVDLANSTAAMGLFSRGIATGLFLLRF